MRRVRAISLVRQVGRRDYRAVHRCQCLAAPCGPRPDLVGPVAQAVPVVWAAWAARVVPAVRAAPAASEVPVGQAVRAASALPADRADLAARVASEVPVGQAPVLAPTGPRSVQREVALVELRASAVPLAT